MKQDLWRFTGFIIISLLAGLVSGQYLLCLLAGCILYIYLQYHAVLQLLAFVRRRKDADAPDMPGVVDEISKEFDFLRMHHRQRKKKLSGYLKRFRKTTAALPDAMIVLARDGSIEWANEKAQEYFGIRIPQDTGQRFINLIRHPDLVRWLLKAGKGDDIGSLEMHSPLNSMILLELRLAPYGNKEQLLIARDVTQVHRNNQMRRDFIANASHELRTPLTVISGYLESLEDHMDSELQEWKNQIKQMRNQSERMRRLIEDLLKLALLETAEGLEEEEFIGVHDLLVGIHKEARALHGGDMQQDFSLEADRDVWLRGNRNQIYSAFSNLIFNAIQHTPDNGVIRVRWFADETGAVLEVSDSGEGIDSEHLPRLTERFYRVDKGRSRERGGTGLGLAIVKHILVLHDAGLEIESEPGKGSTFRCRFKPEYIAVKPEPGSLTQSA